MTQWSQFNPCHLATPRNRGPRVLANRERTCDGFKKALHLFAHLVNSSVVMCGRYRLTAKERYLRDHFGLDGDVSWTPRWNIAPTQQVPVVRQNRKEPKRTIALLRWGLIPFWAKDASIGFKTINAVSKTAAEKPAFRDAMKLRRCLIPADGFYEWETLGTKVKLPYNFGMAGDALFAFAGLWERWRIVGGKTAFPNAYEVKALSPHHRFVIALHSRGGVCASS